MGKSKKRKSKKGSGAKPKQKKKASSEANPSGSGTTDDADKQTSEPSDPATDVPIARVVTGKDRWDAEEANEGKSPLLAEDSKSEPDVVPTGIAATVEKLDKLLGKVELVFVAFFVVALTFVGVYQFVMVTLLKGNVDWADEMIRFLVFFTAMSAAALAAQQRRMMAIDIIPRLLKPKVRAASKIVLALFVVFVCVLLIWAGLLNRASEMKNDAVVSHALSVHNAMLALPIGAALIGLHFLFQAIIDGSYLLRGIAPPEPEMSVH